MPPRRPASPTLLRIPYARPTPPSPSLAAASAGGLTVRIGDVLVTGWIVAGSMTLRVNAFDFVLKSVNAAGVALPKVPNRRDSVAVIEPAWDGMVVSVTIDQPDTKAMRFYRVTATNTKSLGAAPAPFGLDADAPNGYSTFRCASVTLTESVTASDDETRGSLVCWQPGLWPGMTFALTCANLGLAATQYTISDVEVTWPDMTHPEFAVSFGDVMVTLDSWISEQGVGPLGGIVETFINNEGVSTPRLAANVVETRNLALVDDYGQTILTAAGFGTTWTDFIRNGLYNSMFSAAIQGSLRVGASADDATGRNAGLPNWTVWGAGASFGATVASDPAAAGGFRVDLAQGSAATLNITSDLFPVVPGMPLGLTVGRRLSPILPTVTETVSVEFFTAAETSISSSSLTARWGTPKGSNFVDWSQATPPAAARWARVTLTWTTAELGADVSLYYCSVANAPTQTDYFYVSGNVQIAGAGSTLTDAIGWDSTAATLTQGDGTYAKPLNAGWQPYALPVGAAIIDVYNATYGLAVVGGGNSGCVLIPFHLTAPMRLQELTLWCPDTSGIHAAEWSVYGDWTNAATVTQITGATGTYAFTPVAASQRASTAATPGTIIPPGQCLLAIRNTSAAVQFGLGFTAAGTMLTGVYSALVDTTTAALGATLDTSGFTGLNARSVLVRLNGLSLGRAVAWA